MRLHKKFIQRVPQGFAYLPDFINPDEKRKLLAIIESHEWDHTIRRRQQHYGLTYYQTSHHLSHLQPVDPMHRPAHNIQLFGFVIDRLISRGLLSINNPPNQCLVNEYIKSSYLAVHVENR